jgi:hypothetical protein
MTIIHLISISAGFDLQSDLSEGVPCGRRSLKRSVPRIGPSASTSANSSQKDQIYSQSAG